MNKSAFQMMWETISSDIGIMSAVKAWLWTAIIIMIACLPLAIKESFKAILEVIAVYRFEKELKNDKQTDMHER